MYACMCVSTYEVSVANVAHAWPGPCINIHINNICVYCKLYKYGTIIHLRSLSAKFENLFYTVYLFFYAKPSSYILQLTALYFTPTAMF